MDFRSVDVEEHTQRQLLNRLPMAGWMVSLSDCLSIGQLFVWNFILWKSVSVCECNILSIHLCFLYFYTDTDIFHSHKRFNEKPNLLGEGLWFRDSLEISQKYVNHKVKMLPTSCFCTRIFKGKYFRADINIKTKKSI